MLTNEELVEAAKAGNANARELLVHKNMGLVVQAARGTLAREYTIEDLVQEGVIGVLEAIEAFDKTRGAAFSTVAGIWIRSKMLKAIEGRTATANQQRKAFWRLKKARRAAFDEGVELTAERLADMAGVSLESAAAVLAAHTAPAALDKTFPDAYGEPTTLHDFIADPGESPEDVVIREDEAAARHAALKVALASLKPRSCEIVECHLLADEPETFEGLGDRLGISRERVRQIEVKAIEHIRDSMTATLAGRKPAPKRKGKPGRPRKERPIEKRRERVEAPPTREEVEHAFFTSRIVERRRVRGRA